mmetsp:Transcript_6423/g.16766  ORF Transcript_6423/g.16766 Transcript_6423/m.16766 type:complete len:218 (+) Transcript_6423:194-847(+)
MAASFILMVNMPASGFALATAVASPASPPAWSSPFTPASPQTLFSHSVALMRSCLSLGTYATMDIASVPAEKIILPTCPDPPRRSSPSGSGTSFIASMDILRYFTSPSGFSIVVQKNSSPPMSAAPSISTPFFPPSLVTSLMSFFSISACFAAFIAAISSADGGPPPPPPPSFFFFLSFFFFCPVSCSCDEAGASSCAVVVVVAAGAASTEAAGVSL